MEVGASVSVDTYLAPIILMLSASSFGVALLATLGISPILGYFLGGMLIGSYGLGLVNSSVAMGVFAEFGVVLLLFIIGLELTVNRLISMRKHVFGFGSLQVMATALIFTLFSRLVLEFTWEASLVIGVALSFSSTAIVLQLLQETGYQTSRIGRLSIATLLMQDFTVVPALVLVPLLHKEELTSVTFVLGAALIKALVVLILIFTVGCQMLRPLFSLMKTLQNTELFMSVTLLLVLGASFVTEKMELSLAMGAFVAGLLVAETDYRHEVEQVIVPFKRLLLGLFFMTVGMSINLPMVLENIEFISLAALGIICIKAVIIFVLARAFGFSNIGAIKTGALLAQCSEFAIILLGLEASVKLVGEQEQGLLLAIITLTMTITPLVWAVLSRSLESRDGPHAGFLDSEAMLLSANMDVRDHVIVVGFGHIGKIVARMLDLEKVPYVVIESKKSIVAQYKDSGIPIYHGSASRMPILKALNTGTADAVVVTVSNFESKQRIAEIITTRFPDTTVLMSAGRRKDVKLLPKSSSSVVITEESEVALQLGAQALASAGVGEIAVSLLRERIRNIDVNTDLAAASSEK